MHKHQRSKYSLFLIELMIALFFFMISSVICVQFYAKAHIISTSTNELSTSIQQAENAAEIIKSNPENINSTFLSLYPNATYTNNHIVIAYNHNWKNCSLENAIYFMTIDWTLNSNLISAKIEMLRNDPGNNLNANSIYYLKINKHISNKINPLEEY